MKMVILQTARMCPIKSRHILINLVQWQQFVKQLVKVNKRLFLKNKQRSPGLYAQPEPLQGAERSSAQPESPKYRGGEPVGLSNMVQFPAGSAASL